MAKTNASVKPKSKPSAPTEVEVTYDLFDLPTAFHKAGLAGLVMLVESLKNRRILSEAELKYARTATTTTLTLTEPILRKLMDDVYDARIVEKRYTQPKKKDNKPIPPKRVDVERREEGGKIKETKWHVYDEVEPKGQFLRDHYPDEDGLWLKLWREMLWSMPRSQPTTREPYNQRAKGDSCKEALNTWSDLQKVQKARIKNGFHTTSISGALLLGAQAVNAEGVPFEGRAEQNLLLHFWPFAVLLYVPQQIDADGSVDFAGFALAIPDVSNLENFILDYPHLLNSLSKDVRGYRPAQSVIDLPAEGAFAFLDNLAMITGLQVETGDLRFSIGGVEYLHLVKEGKNVKTMASGRVSPKRKLLVGYRQIVAPKDESTRYRNPLFRRGLLVALLNDEAWYQPFGRTFTLFDAELFMRRGRQSETSAEKGPPQFANDALKKLRHETTLFTQTVERIKTMPESERPKVQAPLSVIINRVVRNYLISKTEAKAGFSLQTYRDEKEGVKWDDIPKDLLADFNEAKQKLALSLFLEFRSRKDQAFVNHFGATFFSVTQRLAEADREELAKALVSIEDTDRRDDLKTLTLLSLSANS